MRLGESRGRHLMWHRRLSKLEQELRAKEAEERENPSRGADAIGLRKKKRVKESPAEIAARRAAAQAEIEGFLKSAPGAAPSPRLRRGAGLDPEDQKIPLHLLKSSAIYGRIRQLRHDPKARNRLIDGIKYHKLEKLKGIQKGGEVVDMIRRNRVEVWRVRWCFRSYRAVSVAHARGDQQPHLSQCVFAHGACRGSRPPARCAAEVLAGARRGYN